MSGIVTGEEAYGYAFFNCLHPLYSWNDNDEAYLYVRFNRLRVQCALSDIVTGNEEHLHVVFNAHRRVDGQMARSTARRSRVRSKGAKEARKHVPGVAAQVTPSPLGGCPWRGFARPPHDTLSGV
jgi:hypothetical protein